jgi:hypothetical protein
MKQKVKLRTLQYAQRINERYEGAHAGGDERDSRRPEENYLAKNRKYNNGLPGATPTEALLEELRKLYGESGVQRDAFGRRIALPSEIARALNNNRRK